MTTLTRVADDVLAGPVLAEAMADARDVATLDLTGPAAVRPFVVSGLVEAGRTVLAVTATAREAEDLVEELADLVDPARGRLLPELGDAAPRAAEPPQRHRRSTAGRAAPARATPAPTRPTGRCAVVVAPVRSILQPQVKGLADLEPVELVPGQTTAARRRRPRARGRGVLAGRHGREARRVRRPRRHRRRLPADRGAPAAGGVLGRRRRGDPLLRGRRPAHPGRRRAPVGAAVPRAAAHRRGTPPRGRARAGRTRSCWS